MSLGFNLLSKKKTKEKKRKEKVIRLLEVARGHHSIYLFLFFIFLGGVGFLSFFLSILFYSFAMCQAKMALLYTLSYFIGSNAVF
jgi:hypothetical protein